jgi:membrane associated rhomboid family serine protease
MSAEYTAERRGIKIPIVTVIIFLLNLIGLIYEYSVGEDNAIYRFAMYQGALQDGQWIRIFVSAFLHFGIMHFGSNMICLGMFGLDLENKIGWWRYALIYAVSLIGSGLLINFAGGNGIHAGASGAIWGLMTANLVYNLKYHINPIYALRGIVINLVYSFSAGVSWQGHIGGGVAGLLVALVVSNEERL